MPVIGVPDAVPDDAGAFLAGLHPPAADGDQSWLAGRDASEEVRVGIGAGFPTVPNAASIDSNFGASLDVFALHTDSQRSGEVGPAASLALVLLLLFGEIQGRRRLLGGAMADQAAVRFDGAPDFDDQGQVVAV